MTIDPNYEQEILDWRVHRVAALTAEDGWLDLTDRIDISYGTMRVGQGADNDVVLSVGPAHLGVLTFPADGAAQFVTPDGASVTFAPVPDNPPRAKVGTLLLEITSLEGQYALRVRDSDAKSRTDFPGISYFDIDPAWRVEAKWISLDHAENFAIDTITGVATSVVLTYRAEFERDGKVITLLPTHWKSGKPMFVLRDKTAGAETYAASRFLIGQVEGDKVILDFNKAFNPPCAFTEFAVCPLPPRENIMGFDIRAGEKKPLGHA